MRRKVLPVMALNYEAFCACIEQNVKVVYVDMEVYKTSFAKIMQKLEENGYDSKGYPARRGVFLPRESICWIVRSRILVDYFKGKDR